ncbi:MFS transporter [Aeribacillus alveayuensis]
MITFLFFLSLHMLNAGFPIFVSQISGQPALGGIMTTAFMMAAIFSRPFVSAFLYQLNIKKTISITLLFVAISMLISYGSTSIPFLIIIRVIEGAAFGIITTLLATLATSIIPTERTGEGIGFFGMATSLGASLSPALALYIYNSFSFQNILLLALVIILSVFCFSLFIKNIFIGKETKMDHSIIHDIFDKKALFPSVLVFFLCITFGAVFSFMGGLGEEVGLGAKISLFFFIFMFVMLLIRPISGKVFDRFGYKVLIYPSSISGLIGLLLLAVANHLFVLIAAAFFYGIGYGILQPTLQSWAVSLVAREKKGTANAMIFTGMDLGMALGSPIFGMVAGIFGYREMFGYSSICILFILVFYMFSSKNQKLEETKEKAVLIQKN